MSILFGKGSGQERERLNQVVREEERGKGYRLHPSTRIAPSGELATQQQGINNTSQSWVIELWLDIALVLGCRAGVRAGVQG